MAKLLDTNAQIVSTLLSNAEAKNKDSVLRRTSCNGALRLDPATLDEKVVYLTGFVRIC